MATEERQHAVLDAIATLEGERGADTANSSQVAEALNMRTEDVEEALSDLADKGYVTLESTESDYVVSLTQQGRETLTH